MPSNDNNINIPTIKSIGNSKSLQVNTDEDVCQNKKVDTSNINLNSTLKITYTDYYVSNNGKHTNAIIWLKDTNSNQYGTFYPISVHNPYPTDPDSHVNLIFNGNIVIDTGNLEQEIEYIFDERVLDLSSITITGNCTSTGATGGITSNLGYLNFSPTGTNIPSGTGGVGFRYEPNTSNLQFATDPGQWFSFDSLLNAAYFRNLLDVSITDVHTRQYITAGSVSGGNATYINGNLAIFDDPTPKLASNLNINSFGLVNNGGGYVINPIDTTSNNSSTNYIVVQNSAVGGGNPVLTVAGSDTNIDLEIATKGSGDILLIADNGNVSVDSKSFYCSGYSRVSTYYTSEGTNDNYTTGGFIAGNTSYNLPISSDTVIFDFNAGSPIGTYTANVPAGYDEGQILNLIFYWSTPNDPPNDIKVVIGFGAGKLGMGDKFGSKILFNTPGQSASLIYITGGLISSGIWQLRNTGAYVE